MANFDVGSRHGGALSSVVGWLAGAEQAGHMTMTLYERNLKAGSEYDYLASRAALAMGTTRARVDSYAQTYGGGQAFGSSGIRGISMMDVAEVQRYVSDPTQVSQIAMFARMAGMNPGAASRDVRQLGKQFNLQPGVVANIVAGSRNTGGTLDEQELLAAAQYAAPFAANQSNTRTPQGKLANVLAMSQALADYGIDVDRGTRMLMQHMAMPDLTMAVRMKQVHDYRGRQTQPNVTQAELDRTFTSETYWQDQLQVAQMRNYNASAPYRLLEQRVSGGLDTQGRSLLTPTSGPVSYADKVMQAPLAQLSSAGLDFRQMKVNLDFEAKNLQRQSSLLDIQERMQARDIQIQRVGLGIQGLGLRQGLEMLGLRREEFGLQKQANQLDLQDTRLDVQTMQIRGQYAQETSDLQYQKANIEYAARQRDLRLQQRMLPVQAKQLDVTMEAQAASISWQEQGVAFKRWYDTQMYGAIGTDRSYRAYLATQQGAADEGRAAGYSTTAAQSLYGRTQQQVGQVPVMGLQNEQFYAGIQHQLAQLQYGRTAFRSEASYSENVQYIKKQTEFYERRMAVEDKAREFSYRMADEQLAIAKKQYEVQKELLGFQKEQLQNQIADAERLIPIEQRLNELNHLIETAEIKQLPERIAIALGKLQIKEQQIPLAEKMTAKQLANEEAMLRAQGAQLALSLANLADQEKQNKEQMALRRAELENAKKNLEFREEQARRESELLQAKQIQIELSYKLAQREAEIYTYLESSHAAVRDKGLGTESGKVMDFTEFAKTIADMVKSGRLDKGVLDQMTSSWTDPALVAAVKAAMDGTLDRYEKDILAKADAAVSAGGKTEIDRAYGQITQQGGFEYAEFEKTLQAQQIAMKHAADSTNDLVFALEKFKGALGEATGALHGPGGELGSIAGIGKDLAQLFLNLKLVRTIGAGAAVAGTGADVGAGLAAGGGAVVAGSVSTVVAAAIGIITGGVGLGLIADSAWKYISGKYLHDQLGDMLLGKDSSTGILDTRQDAQTNQALTEWNKTERPTYQIALAQRYAGTDDNLGDPLARAIYDRAVLPSLQPYLDSARNAGFGGGGGSGWGQDADMKAALTDAIQKAAPNDPALPVLQQVLATLSSDGFAAGALPAIARNVQMLSDLTDQNDTEATRNLQAILKQANDQNHALQQLNGLGGTTNKTLALHSITLQKLEKSGFDTVDSIKATNRDIVRNAKLTGDVVATQERMIKELSPIQKGIDRSALVAQQQKAILLDLYGGQSEQTTILKQGFKGLVKDLADKLANGIKDYADQRQKQQGDIPKYDIGAQEITRDQLAFLHRGEAVLTPNEAAAYRAGLKTAPEQSVQASIERAPLAGNMDKPQGATYHIESIEIHNDIRGEISEETLRKLKKANTESIIEALKKVTNR